MPLFAEIEKSHSKILMRAQTPNNHNNLEKENIEGFTFYDSNSYSKAELSQRGQ